MQKGLSNHIAKSVPGFGWFTFLDFQLRCHQNVRQGRGVEPSAFSRRFFAFSAFFCRFFRRCPVFRLMQQQGGGGQEFEQLSHTRTNIWTADHPTLITNPHLIENTDFQPKCHDRYIAYIEGHQTTTTNPAWLSLQNHHWLSFPNPSRLKCWNLCRLSKPGGEWVLFKPHLSMII